ncbi:MAG: phenylalanine 4-monooxygenase [Ignavibacteriaceae bacterium]|nr:phenylalanine 4-monooxygenase [Ignavibacteriaceae bacterium]
MNQNDQNLSAYEKAAGKGIDPRCIPQKLTSSVPVDNEIIYPEYPDTDHETWKTLFKRQMKYLPGKVCQEYLDGVHKLNFSEDKIPSLKEISSVFKKETGWKIARVPGLIHEQNFFELLQQKIFPSTDYIRGKEELDYTPAPDLFHDIFGHMPLLTNKNFASFYQMFGEAALKAEGPLRTKLETFHWFTVEFGLIRQKEGLRIYGAGIVSSSGEVQHALSTEVEVKDFVPEELVNQPYEVWHLQPVLFAIESFEQLEEGFKEWTKRNNLLK